jgi:methionyl aminopeptidase
LWYFFQVIIIKTPEEIENMREGGRRHAQILQKIAAMVRPGISTWELDQAAEKMIKEYGDIPAFKGYKPDGADHPYPATLITSVNDEVVHGIPSKERILEEGDIIALDLGVKHNGVFTDAAITVPVGKISKELNELLMVTEEALAVGIAAAKPGVRIGDISYAIQSFVNKRYGIVEGFAGHGVGRHIHEDPYVPNYGRAGSGELLVPGMTIAIEPMLNIGTKQVMILDDGYTVVTRDGKPSAHFEHTVLITEHGAEILTI